MKEKDADIQGADFRDPYYEMSNTVSATECTGLVPSGVECDEQADNYAEMYGIHPPRSPRKQKGKYDRK
ncbi:MAG: hypothetical protein ACOYJC_07955 [Christensenellales bacterium]